MPAKVIIGGAPVYENSFSDCVFLGKADGHDLYLLRQPGKAPDVLARSGNEPGDYVEGLCYSYGADPALTAARRIAEFKGLLSLDPIKALYHVHQPEDVARVQKALVTTPEYRALAAFEAGDSEGANRILDEILDSPALLAIYPHDRSERLKHADMNLYVMGKFLNGAFSFRTYATISGAKFAELAQFSKDQS